MGRPGRDVASKISGKDTTTKKSMPVPATIIVQKMSYVPNIANMTHFTMGIL